MPNKFYLEIITPEKTFYRGDVESIQIPAVGGDCMIMAGHQPMVFATQPGMIAITTDGQRREAFMSEGFIEVRPDATIAFSQAVEWPEDIDERRAGRGEGARRRDGAPQPQRGGVPPQPHRPCSARSRAARQTSRIRG